MSDSFEKTLKFIEEEKNRGKTVALKKGVFDLIHPDHVNTLNYIKSLADVLVVLIIGDNATRLIKPGRPIQDEQARITVISSLKAVDFCELDYDSFNPITGDYSRDIDIHYLRLLNPDIWAVSQGQKAKFENYDMGNIKMVELPEGNNFSTTKIINKIISSYGLPQQ